MYTFEMLTNKIEKIRKMGFVKASSGGTGAIGITLEHLLGKEKDELPIPDFDDIELKCKEFGSERDINLFNAVPDSYLFENNRIRETYGYPDKDFPQYKVFNQPINAKYLTRNKFYNFKLFVDWENKKVIMNVYDKHYMLIDNDTAWSFELLEQKSFQKLKKLLLVKARKWIDNGCRYYKYEDVYYYEFKSFYDFLKAIENGYITVKFKIGIFKYGDKLGKTYDHGTSFGIQEKNLNKIYNLVK